MKESKKLKDIDEGSLGAGDFSLPKLSDFEGKEITIDTVRFSEGNFGEYAVIKTTEYGNIRTSNVVILKQLHNLADYLNQYNVKAKVKKIKRYYVLS